MSDISVESIDATREMQREMAVSFGDDPSYSMFQFQKDLVAKSPKYQSLAALFDIWDIMPKSNKADVVKSINMGIESYKKLEASFTEDDFNDRKTFILDALNNALPSILEHKDHKARHWKLVWDHASAEIFKGSNNSFHSWKTQVMDSIHTLYGETTVLRNNTPMKVGFPKALLEAADVGQDQWTDSNNYFFAMAHRKYKGSLSFVPRLDIVNEMRAQKKWAESFRTKGDVPKDDGTYIDEQGKKRQRINTPWNAYDPEDDKWMKAQENQISNYNPQWKQIYEDIVTNGKGNIWIERINDSKDLNRIRLVIVKGDRNFPDDVEIIGDVYGMNQGQSETAGFSRDNAIKFMQARQAWQWGNSTDDAWDAQDWIHSIVKNFEQYVNRKIRQYDGLVDSANKTLGMGGAKQKSPLLDLDWIPIEEGGDLSRDEIEVLYNAYSKTAWEKKHKRKFDPQEHATGGYRGLDGYSDLSTTSFGGRYATEFTLPGRVEADMFLEPLYNEIIAHEKSIGRKLKSRHEEGWEEDIEVLYDIVQVVKSRLDRNPDIFDTGKSIFSYVLNDDGSQNLFFQPKAEPSNRLDPKRYEQTPIPDWIGRGIKHLQGEKGKALFDIARKLSPYVPDKDRPKSKAEILDPSTWDLHPPMHGWLD